MAPVVHLVGSSKLFSSKSNYTSCNRYQHDCVKFLKKSRFFARCLQDTILMEGGMVILYLRRDSILLAVYALFLCHTRQNLLY